MVETFSELAKVEQDVNQFIKDKKIKVYHGLLLRNSIEQRENEIRGHRFFDNQQSEDSHDDNDE